MADALTGKTEVDSSIEDIVSLRVQSVLTAEMKVWPLMSDFSTDGIGPGMDTLKIQKFGSFTVGTKAENVAADAAVNAFSADSLLMDQYKYVQFLIEDIAGLQAKINIQAAYIDQASRDLAADMDKYALKQLDDNPSTSGPDHDMKYADTATNHAAKTDILETRRLLNEAKVPESQRWGIIPPDKEKDIMNISEFVRVDESGGSAALRNGQIGRLFGYDIVMVPTSQLDLAGASFWGHVSAMAVGRQLQPKIESMRDLAQLGDRHSISHIYGAKVLDSGKRYVRITET